MGFFSYLCKECGKPIESGVYGNNPQWYNECRMDLLENGKVIESRVGSYDGYGRICPDKDSPEWQEGVEWTHDWDDCLDLHFDDDKSNGFVAVHKKCDTGKVYTERSEDDPSQGGMFDWIQLKNGKIKLV